jgi:acyl-CoA synthetase (AMP-forming)/AMP-acid ligase II/7-keto-8-aminopelargonate synthetase-like enzyme/acyl carrier protein
MATLLHRLARHARHTPDRIALRFLGDGADETDQLTYAALAACVASVARSLEGVGSPGERALIACPQGLEYVVGFLGCLAAGWVAVPVPPLERGRLDGRVDNIARACTPRVVLLTPVQQRRLASHWLTEHYRTVQVVTVDRFRSEVLPASHGRGLDDLAFLQFTSGSTAEPRGVMVSQRNLTANLSALETALEQDSACVTVGWMPLWHDMGLVGHVLLSVYAGSECVLLPPAAFLRRPFHWLHAITRFRGTGSGAPPSAFDSCVERISQAELARLDLRTWRTAPCGAEPVAADTLERFVERFGPQGFAASALRPCYGLAEVTCLVTAQRRGDTEALTLDADVLETGRACEVQATASRTRRIVSCGAPADDSRVLVVSADRREPLPDGEIGEIWVQGLSVAQGYWELPKGHPFGGRLATGEGPFLRTGDVGFLSGGSLFVTGRSKDLIIVHGRNHHPHDLERTACEAQSAPACAAAAFAVDAPRRQRLVVVREVRRGARSRIHLEAIARDIRRRIADHHALVIDSVVLVPPHSIPRTSSGKIRRSACRTLYQRQELKVLHESRLERPERPRPALAAGAVSIGGYLDAYLARRGATKRALPDDHLQADLGLDSLQRVELALELEKAFGVAFDAERLACIATVRDLEEAASDSTVASGLTALQQRALRDIPQLRVQVDEQRGREVRVNGRWLLDFASANYLALDLHPEPAAAIAPAVRAWGAHPSWTRIVASPAPYRELEQRLAALLRVPATLVFPTVSLLHLGLLPLLAGPQGALVVDRLAHHSIHEAALLASARGARLAYFRSGDLEDLELRLRECSECAPRLVAVDGVYSMSGGFCPLAELAAVARRHGASVYVDDAHGFGVLGSGPSPVEPYGQDGSGIARHLGLDCREHGIIYIGALSKALSSLGAFVTCRDEEQQQLFATASTAVFSGPCPTASLATALAGLDVLSREGPAVWSRLHRLTLLLVDGARALGFAVDNTGGFPIASLVIGRAEDAIRACQILWEEGLLITPGLFPAVPLHRSVVRFSVTAAHTDAQIDRALQALEAVCRALGLAPGQRAAAHQPHSPSSVQTVM